jgi:hypothetical protein
MFSIKEITFSFVIVDMVYLLPQNPSFTSSVQLGADGLSGSTVETCSLPASMLEVHFK